MADPNFTVPYHDDPYYNPYTDYSINIVDNLNPALLADSPLVPQSSEKCKEIIDIETIENMDFWDLYDESSGLYSQVGPFGINGETSTRIETNLENQRLNNMNIPTPEYFAIQEPENPVPESSHSGPSKMTNGEMSNQGETNLGNGILNNTNLPIREELTVDEFFSFPSLAIDPLQKTIISGGMFNGFCEANSQGSSSKTYEENGNRREKNVGTQKQHSVRPSEPVPVDCSSCDVLREIIHIKGPVVMKLQIHGRLLGIFFHAILDVKLSTKAVRHEMFDFCQKEFEEVKQFLTQYCSKRRQEGYIMIKDPRSTFYEALCIGLDWYENLPDADYTEITLTPHPGDIQIIEAANDSNNQDMSPISQAEQVVANGSNEATNSNHKQKSHDLKEQRKRAKEITFKDLSNFFHLTRKEAAEILGFSETVIHNIWLKKVGAGKRWPFRKVQSIQKGIANLRALLNSDDPHERIRAGYEIRNNEEKMNEIYKEPKERGRNE